MSTNATLLISSRNQLSSTRLYRLISQLKTPSTQMCSLTLPFNTKKTKKTTRTRQRTPRTRRRRLVVVPTWPKRKEFPQSQNLISANLSRSRLGRALSRLCQSCFCHLNLEFIRLKSSLLMKTLVKFNTLSWVSQSFLRSWTLSAETATQRNLSASKKCSTLKMTSWNRRATRS